jgi:hypothetical protein
MAALPGVVANARIFIWDEAAGQFVSLSVQDIVGLERFEQADVLSFPQHIEAKLATGSAVGTVARVPTPPGPFVAPAGKVAYISYLKLTTPPEATGNIEVSTKDSATKALLATDQDANSTVTYDVAVNWGGPIRTTKVDVRATAAVATTADRIVALDFGGWLADKRY